MADEPLGRMVIELGLDDAGLGKGLQGARKAVRSSMAEMKASMAVIGQAGGKFDLLSAKSSGLAKVIMAQRGEVNELGKAYKNSLVDGQPSAQTAKLASQFNNASAKLAALNKQYIDNARAAAEAKVQTTGVTGAMNTMGNGAIKVGRSVTSVGDTMTKRVTAPIALGFAAAGKAAISFNSQIDAMGPLLTNGGAVTAKYRAQLDQMAESSKKWAVQYGVSTTQINNGMSELVKRGFTTNQVLGSMPSILDATKASGEDMGTVMNATASIVEQFGLKTNSTAGTMKNTQMVTDSLTYAANATASGFGDLSEAFSYVGPVAASAGLSVQQTAAAIGVLSDRGIEGQKAGTGLRSILTSLVKPTRAAKGAFDEMGISSSELKRDSKDLPQLIRDITEGTKGWDKADRNKAIATAFGKENQTSMNALISAGADKLQNLTDKTNAAGGATKRVAEEMMKTPAERLKRLQQQFEVTAITLGEKLMPYIVKGMDTFGKLADAFGNLSPKMQDFIVKLGVGAAAAGPLLSVFGRLTTGSGKVLTGIVKLAAKLAGLKAARTAASDLGVLGAASNTTKDQLSLFGNAAEGVGTKATSGAKGFTIFGKALTTGGTGAGVLGSALTPLGATVLGVGAAVAVGAVIWEGWGKQAVAAADRTSRWGTDVGAAADKSLGKMSEFSGNASAALETWSSNSEGSAKKVSGAFSDMYSQISKDAESTNKKIDKNLASLPASVAATLTASAEARKKQNNDTVASAKETTTNVNNIVKRAGEEHRKLTDDENTYIANSQQKLNQQEVATLNITGKQKKTVLAALNGEINNMTKQQRSTAISALQSSFEKEYMLYGKQKKTVTDMYKSGEISADSYHKALNKLADDHKKKNETMAESVYKLGKANGESAAQIDQDLQTVGSSYDKVAAKIKKQSKSAKESSGVLTNETGNMSKTASKAAKYWNDLVWDKKTGIVKTNAQEEVTKAVASESGWKQIKYDLKHANLSSNAKELIATAVLQNGKWNNLTWPQQKALIRTNSAETMYNVMKDNGTWDQIKWEQQAALINSNTKGEVGAAMIDNGHWNDLTWEQQKALVQTNAGETAMEALMAKGQWDGMSLEAKEAIVRSNSKAEIAQAIFDAGQWNNLEFDDQEALVTNKASKPVMEALNDAGKWNDLSIQAKQAIVQAKGKDELADIFTQYQLWNSLPSKEQIAAIKSKGGKELAELLDQLGFWNQLDPDEKNAVAHAKGKEELFAAMGGLESWNNMSLEQKQAVVHEIGSESVARSLNTLYAWQTMTPDQKTASIQALGNSQMLEMIGGINTFNGLDPKTQQAVAVAIGNGDITALTNTMNQWTGLTPAQQWAIANTRGSDQVWAAIGTFQNWNGLPQNVKTSIAQQIGQGDVQEAINTFNGWNKLTPKQQTAIAKQVGKGDVQGAISTIMSWSKTSPGGTKTANAKDSASGPMGSATRSTKTFKSTSPGGTKTANGRDNTSRPLGAATRSTNIFRGTSPGSTKNANGSDHTSQPFGTAKRSIDRFRGTSPGGAKRATAVDNASGPAHSASRAVDGFSARRSHTVTLTTITRNITEFIKKHLKGGTSDFEGGTMMVNDQAGPMFRELVQFPTGETFVPHGRNVVFNAPKHTKVVPAGKTNRLLGGIPQFANGIGGIPENADYLQDARNLTTQLNQQVVQMDDSRIVDSNNQTTRMIQASQQQQAELMQQQSNMIAAFMNLFAGTGIGEKLQSLAEKKTELKLDGASFSKQMAPFNSVNQVQRSNFADRGLSIDQSI
ncbi:phage tail tape measure protein [Loigolactobacillus jiayinensis]|uniref:Phage tail tape measure protein n=1 Tax=Loigolactobacillus jiayinensis TaxID=2486016 RepID=A0ABW1RED3_9LACO|nr:phage tail tape measure protein [Loigolactobacillus jiayinensis]